MGCARPAIVQLSVAFVAAGMVGQYSSRNTAACGTERVSREEYRRCTHLQGVPCFPTPFRGVILRTAVPNPQSLSLAFSVPSVRVTLIHNPGNVLTQELWVFALPGTWHLVTCGVATHASSEAGLGPRGSAPFQGHALLVRVNKRRHSAPSTRVATHPPSLPPRSQASTTTSTP